MKPKFALDLSHEGINLLHRSKGGWSLVGSVDLDDPEMGTHLADLRRRAAALESGGLTCKIIIPNSQVLYTTLEAPGPDDISREVQIRSGLDGLTPYPVGELVFDWRAAGERARVAVLARETMDEAETFAVEHRFNPVSFVARPPQGEFSGEPFFGKTRAATKILGPTERVEPDASPVPRKPPTITPETMPAGHAAPAPGPEAPEPLAAPHSPGELAWQPPAEPETVPTREPAPAAAPPPKAEARDEHLPSPDPDDDPFAELDAIQAELSGDPDAVPAFRSRASRPQSRSTTPRDTGADQKSPPPLAPFPPTSDDGEAMPAPTQPTRKTPTTGKSAVLDRAPVRPALTEAPADVAPASRTAPSTQAPSTPPAPTGPAPSASPKPGPSAPAQPQTQPAGGTDDTPAQPGVAFSTRRGTSGTTTTATATARGVEPDTGDARPAPTAPAQPSTDASAQASGRAVRKGATPSERRRADMADALARPLPGGNLGSPSTKTPEKSGTRGSLSGAVRGAAGGLRSFGQRRSARKDEVKPTDTSMSALMRGAEASDARISPSQRDDEPDLLAGDIAPEETTRTDKTDATHAPAKPEAVPAAAPDRAKQKQPTLAAPATETAPEPKAAPVLAPPASVAADKPKILARAATTKPEKPKEPLSEAEALTVFGARRTEQKSGVRKYLGVILTLLLLLVMAIIGLWSSFFVDDGDPTLFNPAGETAAPETSETAPETAPADVTPDVTPEVAPEETAREPGATVPVDTDGTLTPQVLSQEEAEALYAETQIWQRAPENLGEPATPGLGLDAVDQPGTARTATAAPEAESEPELAAIPGGNIDRTTPLPPPPADTLFELDANGLVVPSPEGTVSPTGTVVFEGAPEVVPPVRPGTPDLPEAAPEGTSLDDAALEQAVEQAVEAAASLADDVPAAEALPEVPDVRPEPRPEDVPDAETPAPDAAVPDVDGDAQLDTASPDAEIVAAAADAASIDAAVDAVASPFADATELAVATSLKPTRKPADIDRIVNAAMASAAAAAAATPTAAAVPETAPATTTPAIPTSASVANQATTPNALNLREINLLGISGPTNARRALVRMENGRYITVKVGDRLDGGRVTSITSDGLTYQKGSRNFTLQLLPLG